MIDLLPPQFKIDKRFAHYNRRLIMALGIVAIAGIIIASVFVLSWVLLDQKVAETDTQLANAEAKTSQYKTIETDAKSLADRLASVQEVQNQQTHFTSLLTELGSVTPQGVYIFSMAVSSGATPSMTLTVYSETNTGIANLKNALEKSPRFSSAALQGQDLDKDPYTGKASYRAGFVVGLKPGALQ